MKAFEVAGATMIIMSNYDFVFGTAKHMYREVKGEKGTDSDRAEPYFVDET